MYQYTSKGYQFIEREEPVPPRQRTHCPACGSFLPKNPTGEAKTVWVVVDTVEYQDATTGEIYPDQGLRLATPEEIASGKAWREVNGGPTWDCPKCGRVYSAVEMFD